SIGSETMNALIAVLFILLRTGMGQDAAIFLWAVLCWCRVPGRLPRGVWQRCIVDWSERHLAPETDSAQTASTTITIAFRRAKRPKLAKMMHNQNTRTTRNGTGSRCSDSRTTVGAFTKLLLPSQEPDRAIRAGGEAAQSEIARDRTGTDRQY